MAIESKFKGGGNFIKTPGEYVVEVTEANAKKSKAGKDMLQVTFQTFEQEKIAGFYVRSLTFHMAALVELKKACGLDGNAPAEMLIGKSCGILVEAQEPDEMGRTRMQITGYGPASAVSSAPKHDVLSPGGAGKSGF